MRADFFLCGVYINGATVSERRRGTSHNFAEVKERRPVHQHTWDSLSMSAPQSRSASADLVRPSRAARWRGVDALSSSACEDQRGSGRITVITSTIVSICFKERRAHPVARDVGRGAKLLQLCTEPPNEIHVLSLVPDGLPELSLRRPHDKSKRTALAPQHC